MIAHRQRSPATPDRRINKRLGRPITGHAADVEKEIFQYQLPCSRMDDFGMKLDAIETAVFISNAAYGYRRSKPKMQNLPAAHRPYRHDSSKPGWATRRFQKSAFSPDIEHRRPYSGFRSGPVFAHLKRHQLQP